MIPKKLIIEGLYSYQKRVEIDFDPLMRAKLFGIFGPVGSGKSSILEAITYAIYGETERLGRTDRHYNMLNLQSDKLFVSFEFEAGGKRFASETSMKRSKHFEKINTPTRQAYVYSEGGRVPCEFQELIDALGGLSYQNFKRTIIIPQGRFQEFLQLGDSERTKMMSELFHLSKYDLADKARRIEAACKSKVSSTEGAIQEIPLVDDLLITDKEKEKAQAAEQIKLQEVEIKVLEQQVAQQTKLKAASEEHALVTKQLEELSKRKQQIKADEEALARAEKMDLLLGKKLNSLENLERNITQTETDLKTLRVRYEKENTAAKLSFEHLKKLKAQSEKWEANQALLAALEQHIAIRRLSEEKKTILSKIEIAERAVSQAKAPIEGVALEISRVEKELEALQEPLEQGQTLIAIDEWMAQFEQIGNKYRVEKTQLESAKKEAARLLKEMRPPNVKGDNPRSWKRELDELLSAAQEKSKAVIQAFEQKNSTRHAEALADQLEEDKPCPVCGSLDHPKPFHRHSEDESTNNEIEASRKRVDELRVQVGILEGKMIALDQAEASIGKQAAELLKSEAQLEAKKESYAFSALIPLEKISELAKLREGFSKAFSKQNTLNAEAKTLRTKIDQKKNALAQQEKALEALSTNLKVCLAKIEGLGEMEEHIGIAKGEALETLETKMESLRGLTTVTPEMLQAALDASNTAEKALTTTKAVGTEKKNQLQKLQEERESINHEALTIVSEEQWGSLEQVKKDLFKLEERNAIRERSRSFREQVSALEAKLMDLDKQLSEQAFDTDLINGLQEKLSESQKQYKLSVGAVAALQRDLEEMIKRIKRRKELTKTLDGLNARLDNIKVVRKLMDGKGFVNYVSSVYLREVVSAANIRFRQMTQQRLSLEVDSRNRFEVVDFLNGGKRRSAKSLSGGQTFQASLCLALAMAERIQSAAGTRQQFFFLDEGFGSLDTQSLDVVLQTLQDLRKENRVVGIISHVNSLKENLPIHLSVMQHGDSGSDVELIQ